MIPPFDDTGVLPPGVHPATLDEIEARFGRQSELRRVQMESVQWMVELAIRAVRPTHHFERQLRHRYNGAKRRRLRDANRARVSTKIPPRKLSFVQACLSSISRFLAEDVSISSSMCLQRTDWMFPKEW